MKKFIYIIILLAFTFQVQSTCYAYAEDPYYSFGRTAGKMLENKDIIRNIDNKWTEKDSLITRRDALSMVYIAKNFNFIQKPHPRQLVWQTVNDSKKQRELFKEYSTKLRENQISLLPSFDIISDELIPSLSVTYDYNDIPYDSFDSILLTSFIGAELMTGIEKEDGLYADFNSYITYSDALVLMNRLLWLKSGIDPTEPKPLGAPMLNYPFAYTQQKWYNLSCDLGIINSSNPYWSDGIKLDYSEVNNYIGANTFLYMLYQTMHMPITWNAVEKTYELTTTWDIFDKLMSDNSEDYIGITE